MRVATNQASRLNARSRKSGWPSSSSQNRVDGHRDTSNRWHGAPADGAGEQCSSNGQYSRGRKTTRSKTRGVGWSRWGSRGLRLFLAAPDECKPWLQLVSCKQDLRAFRRAHAHAALHAVRPCFLHSPCAQEQWRAILIGCNIEDERNNFLVVSSYIASVSDPTAKAGGLACQAPKLTSPPGSRLPGSRSHGMRIGTLE
jgi:hypothetical protein